MRDRLAVTARAPWAYNQPPSYDSRPPNTTRGRTTYGGPLAALHQRRSVEELEALLAERLHELREDPPRGYPR